MAKTSKILIVDDDPSIVEVIRIMLEGQGYLVETAANGREAMSMADDSYDLIILDVMMPEISGLDVCKQLRKASMVPILFLTAKTSEQDKISGLQAGGDDYLVKPFSYAELLSRVQALIRRYSVYNSGYQEKHNVVHKGQFKIDLTANQIYLDGEVLPLTEIEYQILAYLALDSKASNTVSEIYENVWHEQYFASSQNTVTVHIRNIRKKIEKDVQNPTHLKTVWGRGYRLE